MPHQDLAARRRGLLTGGKRYGALGEAEVVVRTRAALAGARTPRWPRSAGSAKLAVAILFVVNMGAGAHARRARHLNRLGRWGLRGSHGVGTRGPIRESFSARIPR